MQERKVYVTYEAIYDIVEAEEHIRYKFGYKRAQKYRDEIKAQFKALSTDAFIYVATKFKYRNYTIYKKTFSPAIIFWIIKDDEVHILRVPREEYDWQGFFEKHSCYEYTYPSNDFI